MEQQAIVDVVARYWEGLWTRLDLGVVDEIFAEPYVRHSSSGTRLLTRAELKHDLRRSWQLLHSPTTTVDDQVCAADRVWTRATTRGIDIDSGERSALTWLVVHRVSAGRIAEAWIASLPGVDWRG